jgi:hypothetical protein
MTIGRASRRRRSRIGDTTSGSAERRPRRTWAEKIVTSTPSAIRAVAVAIVVVGMFFVGLWLVPIEFDLGPVHVDSRSTC